jgi:hypothetical protein
MKTRLISLCICALLLACPKSVPVSTVAGTDDEVMDQYAAQLEELHTRAEVTCVDACQVKEKACGLSKGACDVAGRAADRADFQKKCVTAQEECARFNEACSGCAAH